MRNGSNKKRRKMSAGTVFMLVMLIMVISMSALVLSRLSSGASVDLSKLRMNVLDIQSDPARQATDETKEKKTQKKKKAKNTTKVQVTQVISETPVPQNGDESFTLTVGGSISLAGEVRKNSMNATTRIL